LFRGHETSIDNILKQADMAMYKAKEAGRNRLHFFDPAMQILVLRRAELEASLRQALFARASSSCTISRSSPATAS
jgi:predicted signal transduction protein with EAL and GGDEF domain